MTHYCGVAEAREKMPCMEQYKECYHYEHGEESDMEYSELKEHEARVAMAEEATLPGETLRRIIRAALNPYGWCRNCEAKTEHERRGVDLCCIECDYIAFCYHERPA